MDELMDEIMDRAQKFFGGESRGDSPLHEAAFDGSVEDVKSLLKEGGAVGKKDKFGRTPLYHAAAHGHAEIVNVLLEEGADATEADDEVVDLLIENGADVNLKDEHGITPPHRAARYGEKKIVERLIEAGADVDSLTNRDTPLHKAADEGNPDVAEVLLEAGADPNISNDSGKTPLDVAEEAEGLFGDYEETESVIRSFA